MKKPEEPGVKAEDVSILAWLLQNHVMNEKGEELDFHDRLFLLDILTDWSQEIVIKKCAQIGGSVTFNLKALFAIIKFGWNILYSFPTDSDVQEFVSSKTNKLIATNPQVFAGLPTDNIERKELNGRFLFFKGTVSKTSAIMTTADLLIHDEASRSDQTVIEMMKSRTKASRYKGRWLFSNPTTEKDAIDEAWQKSDQKEWMIVCKDCKLQQILSWPESINIPGKCYQCKGCKGELSDDERRFGKWVPQQPGKTISGYHISLLMAPWIKAEEIVKDSEGDMEYFYNFVLGEPFSPGDLRVSRGTILDNWTPKDLTQGATDWFLGVDVGNVKHYVLGTDKGVVKVGNFTKWGDLDDMMAFYKPYLVIDAMPDNTMAKHYIDKYRGALMSFFQENTSNPQLLVWWGEGVKRGIVYSNRNRILDQLIDQILNANILFGLRSDKDFRDYLRHWETLRRIKTTNNRGIERYEWESTTGEDHYVFATLYYYLALLGRGSGEFFAKRDEDALKTLIGTDNVMGNLGEVMADVNGWENE
jgi:hypothetical protein